MALVDWRDKRTQRLVFSYLKDWILVIMMTVVFFAIDVIPPFHREFSVQDKTIMYPYTVHETVPAWSLVVML